MRKEYIITFVVMMIGLVLASALMFKSCNGLKEQVIEDRKNTSGFLWVPTEPMISVKMRNKFFTLIETLAVIAFIASFTWSIYRVIKNDDYLSTIFLSIGCIVIFFFLLSVENSCNEVLTR